MKLPKRLFALAIASILAGFFPFSASAQTGSGRASAAQARFKTTKDTLNKLPSVQRNMLSVAALNLLKVSDNWARLVQGGSQMQMRQRPAGAAVRPTLVPSPLIPVSNPATDFQLSITSGFTQSETSTAWCASNVVVGFNDSGSFWESFPGFLAGTSGLSFSGVSFSGDAGATFQDAGFVNPGANPANFVVGDPVVACTTPSTFYYAQLFETADSSGNPLTAIGFSTSADGGATWGDPMAAVAKDGFTHFLDKNWMTVDPNNPQAFYVTYTDFDFSGFSGSGACPGDIRTAIELVHSTDGGATWSSPVPAAQFCLFATGSSVQGSQVAVAPDGSVYVSWETFSGPTGATREIDIAKSTTQGASFGSGVKVSDVTYTGNGATLQAGVRTNEFPSLAIDGSVTKTKGNLYIVWNDGRNKQVPDAFGAGGFYGYGDILLSRSTDGGSTWSPSIQVNTNPSMPPTDQFMPGVAVDSTGVVSACWYGRDPMNFRIDRTCGVSPNGGKHFTNRHDVHLTWPPIHATDDLINPSYLGDYDSLASDSLKTAPGFIGAFSIVTLYNPDVFAVKY